VEVSWDVVAGGHVPSSRCGGNGSAAL